MPTNIYDAISSTVSGRESSIYDQQISAVPHILKDMLYKVSGEYFYKGNRTLKNPNTICLEVNYIHHSTLPTTHMLSTSTIKSTIPPITEADWDECYDNIKTLVESNIVTPFILFVNGRFIKWSNITIVSQQGHYYVIINNVTAEYPELHLHEESSSLEPVFVELPHNIFYSEDSILSVQDNTIFAFDTNGYVSDANIPAISIINLDSSIYYKEWVSTIGVNAYPLGINKKYKIFPENIMVFKDGKFTVCNVNIVSTLLSIDSGSYAGVTNNITFKLFYNTKVNTSNDNITNLSLTYLQSIVQAKNAGTDYPDSVKNMLKSFNIDLVKNKKYVDNLLETTTAIMAYNPTLLDRIYSENSNLSFYTTTGAWVKSMCDPVDGYFRMPRKHKGKNTGHVIMLVNGMLYKYYYTSVYEKNTFKVAITDIADADVVEFLFFENSNNATLSLKLNASDNTFHNYDFDFCGDTMNLFSATTDSTMFTYPEGSINDFEVYHTMETNSNNEIKLTLDNAFYYDKPLTVAYKNRFKYKQYKISSLGEGVDEIFINMSNDFRYCNNPSKYMIFFNGRYMSTDQYRLILPVKSSLPFYQYGVYISKPFIDGDTIEVFYVPTMADDLVTYSTIETNGNILIDMSKLAFDFNTNLYMIWIDGKKVSKDNIINVSKDKIKVITDVGSIHSVCVTKYIDDCDYLTPLFKSVDTWSTTINTMTNTEINNMLGITEPIIHDLSNFYNGAIPIASLVYEIVRQYYSTNPNVDITEPFVYDYDTEDKFAIEGVDNNGNDVLCTSDSNRTDNIQQPTKEWP